MKGNTRALVSILIFLGILSVFSIGLIVEGNRISGLTNQTNTNVTIISTGISDISQVQICDFHSDIPIFGGLIWGADCIADFVGYTFSYAGIQTGYIWLGVIFVALTLALVYIGVRVIRGGG